MTLFNSYSESVNIELPVEYKILVKDSSQCFDNSILIFLHCYSDFMKPKLGALYKLCFRMLSIMAKKKCFSMLSMATQNNVL